MAGLTAAAAAYPSLTGQVVRAHWAPTWADWLPRITAWTPVAIVVAVVLLGAAPLAGRLSWRWLLLVAWAATWIWTMTLALVDGRSGIDTTFARPGEYLTDASSVDSVSQAFAEFIPRIPIDAPDRWDTHVAGHPIGALLLFVGLVRLGFDDPFSLGLLVLTFGTTAVTAVMIALRAVAGENAARAATPFLVLGPAAIFVGVSADGVYMAITAWGLAALASATSRTRSAIPMAIAAGLLLGAGVYVSYGLPLIGLIALGTLLAGRTWRPLPWALGGALTVAAVFTAAGFAWWDAYPVLVERYYDGIAADRPYSYWVWANLGAWAICAGVGVGAGIAHGLRLVAARTPLSEAGRAVLLLGGTAVGCLLVATVSGMSKAEVERIWLPFTPWALCLLALLPAGHRRPVLALQVVLALLTQHLLLSDW
uniref:Integral membrane protein n=1 Tax=uncultured Nocardioidaceae bacterium TaxID=253824 RepID=A0A6J4L2I2_9ACTN|nr:MAG: hypothetical protein AVDCRST_MAG46-809 [uncultured Nocardioidaceae bacterium]